MSVSLSKGGNVSLTKVAGEAGLKKVRVGLGWDARVTDGAEFDLDASAFCLNADSKCAGEHDFVFYNNKTSSDGAVQHTGDNRSGSGAGDDESIIVDLEKVAAGIAKVDFTVTIYEAVARKQNFGMVSNAYIRVVNEADGAELARYDLSEDASTETAMVFGQLYKNGTEWKFKAIGQGFAGGLGALASNYGISAA